jgi:crotonobetainyl-CoA:carnitine CoA-transferase CaiB-like acyl-CoA transferase
VPRLIGNASPNIAPYEVFDASDGQMIVTCANQTQFESLCRAIGRLEWIADPRFTSNAARLAHHSELHDLLNAIFRSRSQREWERHLFDAGVPCGPINDYAQAAAHPQAAHRGTRVELPHPLGASAPGVASPMRFSESPVEYRRAPPLLGEHTREVLSQRLSMSAIELDHLEAEGVIATSDSSRSTRAAIQQV